MHSQEARRVARCMSIPSCSLCFIRVPVGVRLQVNVFLIRVLNALQRVVAGRGHCQLTGLLALVQSWGSPYAGHHRCCRRNHHAQRYASSLHPL
jgi:hypothetical protein